MPGTSFYTKLSWKNLHLQSVNISTDYSEKCPKNFYFLLVYTGNATCTNKTCDMGFCVVKKGMEVCVCPTSYIEKNGKCVGKCMDVLLLEFNETYFDINTEITNAYKIK